MAVALSVTEELLEVKLIDLVAHYGTLKEHFTSIGLSSDGHHTTLDKLYAVKVAVNHCESIVCELGLIHKVAHQRQHHLDLSLHRNNLLLCLFFL